MRKISFLPAIAFIFFFALCTPDKKKAVIRDVVHQKVKPDTVIVDCNYTFEKAIAGTNAPKSIIEQLVLIDVKYYSTDNKIHAGQILTNESIAGELENIFTFILETRFPVEKVIPVVRYNWDDELSMQDNNSYSFCYRNVEYSKHAHGMAMDINPYFNPQRMKKPTTKHPDILPEGAVYDPQVPGTLYPRHPVVEEFKKHGFKWGHHFRKKYDDHHFEK